MQWSFLLAGSKALYFSELKEIKESLESNVKSLELQLEEAIANHAAMMDSKNAEIAAEQARVAEKEEELVETSKRAKILTDNLNDANSQIATLQVVQIAALV